MRISDWSSDVCSSDLPHATARASLQPGKELAAKEGAGGDDNGRGGQQPPVAQHHPGYRVAIGVAFDARGLALHNLQIVIAAEQRLDGGAIEPAVGLRARPLHRRTLAPVRSEEHTSELQSLMRLSYAVFCLKKKTTIR